MAGRCLDEAWIEFATGVDIACKDGRLGYLIDAFGDGVAAGVAYLGIELPEEHSKVHVLSTAIDQALLASSVETKRLVSRMQDIDERGVHYVMQLLRTTEGEPFVFFDDLYAFLEDVGRMIDPSMATTSFKNALDRWDEIVARQTRDAEMI
jgi:hypothetical protein